MDMDQATDMDRGMDMDLATDMGRGMDMDRGMDTGQVGDMVVFFFVFHVLGWLLPKGCYRRLQRWSIFS